MIGTDISGKATMEYMKYVHDMLLLFDEGYDHAVDITSDSDYQAWVDKSNAKANAMDMVMPPMSRSCISDRTIRFYGDHNSEQILQLMRVRKEIDAENEYNNVVFFLKDYEAGPRAFDLYQFEDEIPGNVLYFMDHFREYQEKYPEKQGQAFDIDFDYFTKDTPMSEKKRLFAHSDHYRKQLDLQVKDVLQDSVNRFEDRLMASKAHMDAGEYSIEKGDVRFDDAALFLSLRPMLDDMGIGLQDIGSDNAEYVRKAAVREAFEAFNKDDVNKEGTLSGFEKRLSGIPDGITEEVWGLMAFDRLRSDVFVMSQEHYTDQSEKRMPKGIEELLSERELEESAEVEY